MFLSAAAGIKRVPKPIHTVGVVRVKIKNQVLSREPIHGKSRGDIRALIGAVTYNAVALSTYTPVV